MVSVIVNYCSNEKAFLKPLLTECQKFSDDIIVSYGSHLYDGTPEDTDHIAQYQTLFPNVKFVCYDVNVHLDLRAQEGVVLRPAAYWHNLARWTGTCALKKRDGWVFVIDADEIPEGNLVKTALESMTLHENKCYKIANFWYFKLPIYQAKTLEDSVLLIHSKYLTRENIFGDFERDELIRRSGCELVRCVKGIKDAILWNHYSWVRSRQGMLHKIKNWGHSSEERFKNNNADEIVAYVFRDDNVNDIVHGYSYIQVYNKYNILL